MDGQGESRSIARPSISSVQRPCIATSSLMAPHATSTQSGAYIFSITLPSGSACSKRMRAS
jgi:hypothetical protein